MSLFGTATLALRVAHLGAQRAMLGPRSTAFIRMRDTLHLPLCPNLTCCVRDHARYLRTPKPRRPLKGTLPLLPLFRQQRVSRAPLLRWDERFIVPASDLGKIGMTLVREVLDDTPRTAIILASPGDTLLIDNWRMLHGRSAVNSDCVDRVVERGYKRGRRLFRCLGCGGANR
jgi:hypothetical protein